MCNDHAQYPFPSRDVELWTAAGREITPKVIELIDTQLGILRAHSAPQADHSESVSKFVEDLARYAGLNDLAVLALTQAARLHDMGKLALPADLLDGTKGLTKEECALTKQHPVHGAALIRQMDELPPTFRYLAETMAECHHERHRGGGYPNDYKNTQIPFAASIVAVADVLHAIGFRGGYRVAVGLEDALKEMTDPNMDGRFHPGMLALMVECKSPPKEKRIPFIPSPHLVTAQTYQL